MKKAETISNTRVPTVHSRGLTRWLEQLGDEARKLWTECRCTLVSLKVALKLCKTREETHTTQQQKQQQQQALRVTKAIPADVELLQLRQAVINELASQLPGHDPIKALKTVVALSKDACTGWDAEGKVVAMGGWSWAGDDMIAPWLVVSDLADNHKDELMARARKFIAELQNKHPGLPLVGQVTKANSEACTFLQALGFTLEQHPDSPDSYFCHKVTACA